jgi:protein-L-isoaspartate(D-aspartate) O-methyltransferase
MLPASWRGQLALGGRLLAVVGDPPVMTARLITCVTEGAYNETGLFETCITPLRNAPQPERFVF